MIGRRNTPPSDHWGLNSISVKLGRRHHEGCPYLWFVRFPTCFRAKCNRRPRVCGISTYKSCYGENVPLSLLLSRPYVASADVIIALLTWATVLSRKPQAALGIASLPEHKTHPMQERIRLCQAGHVLQLTVDRLSV